MKKSIMLDRVPFQNLLLLDRNSIVSEVLNACLIYDETGAYEGGFSGECAEKAFSQFVEGMDKSRTQYENAVWKAKQKEARKIARREARKEKIDAKKEE